MVNVLSELHECGREPDRKLDLSSNILSPVSESQLEGRVPEIFDPTIYIAVIVVIDPKFGGSVPINEVPAIISSEIFSWVLHFRRVHVHGSVTGSPSKLHDHDEFTPITVSILVAATKLQIGSAGQLELTLILACWCSSSNSLIFY